MPHNSSQCSWSTSPYYTVADQQTATFQLDPTSFPHVTALHLFSSNLSDAADPARDFTAHGPQPLVNGSITLTVLPFMLYTLSTVNSSRRAHPTPPASTAFPLPYADGFDGWEVDSEAAYFIDQTGSWQVVKAGGGRTGRVMRQQAVAPPINWCPENPVPYSVIGDHAWTDVNVTVDVMVEAATGMAFVAGRVANGGCVGGFLTGEGEEVRGEANGGSDGVVLAVSAEGWWALCNSTLVGRGCQTVGKWAGQAGQWYTLGVVVRGGEARGYVDGAEVGRMEVGGGKTGWAAIGSSWGYVQFDDFKVAAPASGAGEEGEGERKAAVALDR